MSKKTSFKTLLSKTASNPQISLQGVRAQRERLQQLKSGGEPPSKVARTTAATAKSAAPPAARPAPPMAAAAAAPPAAQPAAPSVAHTATSSFMPAGMFAGPRPGFVFKAGPMGLGYYRDGQGGAADSGGAAERSAPETLPPEGNGAADEGAQGSGSSGDSALPRGFFDNPQLDPANRHKDVAKTQKQQTLNEEFDEFQKLVSADLQKADEADEEEEEDEEEGKLHEAVSVARQLEHKIANLRERVSQTVAASSSSEMGGTGASGSGGGGGEGSTAPAQDGHAAVAGEGEEESEEEEDDDGALDLLDWRKKAV
uniref:ZNF380 coiled-coil domain-containing protein n=1 Tax=Haptolina brevifila TaxID=156173 RepID=A0A7S2C849_9EUKA|mmetsp:Transcript_21528/g.43612  ORF Transcript_21528/g.43612 Transcript_21528/m.43612 type:complete len:313 (+) Transcript_21528:96-1034(+)